LDKMATGSYSKYPYLVTALGVGLMAVSELYSFLREMMFRAMFQSGAGYGSGFSGGRHFGGGGFGLPSILTTIALIIAIIGVLWLGLALRKTSKPTKA